MHGEARNGASYEDRLRRVLLHIQRHLDAALTPDALAQVAGFSAFHFHRIFSAMMGESVAEHVRRLRLERAASRLQAPDATVTDIAFDAGYESVEAFSRAFRAAFRQPPSALRRRRNHALPQLAAPSGVHWSADARIGPLRLMSTTNPGVDAMTLRTETLSDMRVLAVRHIGPYTEIGRAFERLWAWGGPRDAFHKGAWMIAVYYDDAEAVAPGKLRSDAAVVTDHAPDPANGIEERAAPGGRFAVKLHRGPYTTLANAWRMLIRDWAACDRGEIDSRPCFERYLNDPSSTAPEDLLTDLYLPIKSGPALEIRYETFPATRMLAVRHVGAYQGIGHAFGKLNAWVQARRLPMSEGALFAIYYDDLRATPLVQRRSDAALASDAPPDPAHDVEERHIAGGRFAVHRYQGPNEGIGAAWHRFLTELAERRIATAADGRPYMDHYVNDPRTTRPEERRTDLYVPVKA